MEKVKITFASSGEIEAEKNGTCFIVEEPFAEDIKNDLSIVTIEEEDGTVTEFHNAELIECASVDERYWYSFREVTADEQLRADVDYLLLMQE